MNSLKLIESLSNAFGAPGFESDVVKVAKSNVDGLSFSVDLMENAYIGLEEKDDNKITIMIDGHTDEVGFMVQYITSNGLIKFLPLGGWIPSNVPAHMAVIKNADGELVRGIISSKPPHFMSESERAKKLELEDMYIDIGASSKDDVINNFKINIGSPVVPDVDFTYNEQNGIMIGKAFDCRLGVAAVVEIMNEIKNKNLDVNVVGSLSTQEECGLRGAKVTSAKIKPDLAIVFEGTPADDTIRCVDSSQAALGKGVQMRHRDSSMVANPRFIKYATDIANKNNIKVQHAVRKAGGTNGGSIHLNEQGIPTIVLGVPSRYIHTHYSMSQYADYKEAVKFAVAIIKDMNKEKFDNL